MKGGGRGSPYRCRFSTCSHRPSSGVTPRDPVWAAGAGWWPRLRGPGLKDVVPGTRDRLHFTGGKTEADGTTEPLRPAGRTAQALSRRGLDTSDPGPSSITNLSLRQRLCGRGGRLPFAGSLGTEGTPFPAARGARTPHRPRLNGTPSFPVTAGHAEQAVGAAPANPRPGRCPRPPPLPHPGPGDSPPVRRPPREGHSPARSRRAWAAPRAPLTPPARPAPPTNPALSGQRRPAPGAARPRIPGLFRGAGVAPPRPAFAPPPRGAIPG